MNKLTKPGKKINPATIILALAVLILAGILISGGWSSNGKDNKTERALINDDGDLVITKNDISSEAAFYPVEIEGTQLEVLAVEAADGSIRTAFNTCQICYSSGRGYYKQEGDVLVCQNCGNGFKTSDVEVIRGGCNPVPIAEEDKVTTEDTIIISYQFLAESKAIFANWKNAY